MFIFCYRVKNTEQTLILALPVSPTARLLVVAWFRFLRHAQCRKREYFCAFDHRRLPLRVAAVRVLPRQLETASSARSHDRPRHGRSVSPITMLASGNGGASGSSASAVLRGGVSEYGPKPISAVIRSKRARRFASMVGRAMKTLRRSRCTPNITKPTRSFQARAIHSAIDSARRERRKPTGSGGTDHVVAPRRQREKNEEKNSAGALGRSLAPLRSHRRLAA